MKFFFPDHHDMVDPNFDFVQEKHSAHRVRQRTDVYAHELFTIPPYHGILVSKTAIEGYGDNSRYTFAQYQRFLRVGVREFFRLDSIKDQKLESMGDCGAFSYFREDTPPFSVDELVEFYESCGFDYGCSLDHIILEYRPNNQIKKIREGQPFSELKRRQTLTLELANQFLKLSQRNNCSFIPVGVAQGWSPDSYALAVKMLQKMGYEWIALGGIAYRNTDEVLECLEAINEVRRPHIKLHLFGISRCQQLKKFSQLGISSIDSTSPLKKAFKDDKDNYYTFDRTYPALRIPQLGSSKLNRRIKAGELNQNRLRTFEQRCLQNLIEYDQNQCNLKKAINALLDYEQLHDGTVDRSEIYQEILEDRPWKFCPCSICKTLGIQVIIFRGAERNKRRGFHNLFITFQQLKQQMGVISA